jgi:ferredoxin-nitrite reductase
MTGFAPDQQNYLKGFMAGVTARQGGYGPPGAKAPSEAASTDPELIAQDKQIAAGGKLSAEEQAKRKSRPLERWDTIAASAEAGVFPKGTDVFLTKYEGLFYVAPAQNAFMCRLRIPGGILSAHQFAGLADLADDCAGGYADVTTRANLQLREIPAGKPIEVLMRLTELGITSRGSGADNIRNITGSPTAGIDMQELLDTRPHARSLHHFILHHRELYGLPRKFNIAFDGGGAIPVLEDTNDIAFTAVEVAEGFGVPAGVYYRLALGGITGHRDFARPTGVIIKPEEANAVCYAILRVFIDNGDRTNRAKARLKYVLDAWGFERFLAETEKVLGRPLTRVADAAIAPPRPQQRQGHIGVHPQKQEGLHYIGIVCPVGRLTSERMRGLAEIAQRFGSGTIRLTVWQNLLISDVPQARVDEAVAAIEALGLGVSASALRGGLVACTGNAGCKFAASNTKRHAAELVAWLEDRIAVDHPINIHLTGCHNSCAQHYIADIGLLGAKVERGEDTVEGYDLHVGGGAGPNQAIGRLIVPGVAADELPPKVLALLRGWMRERAEGEGFQAWSARHSTETLAQISHARVEDAA